MNLNLKCERNSSRLTDLGEESFREHIMVKIEFLVDQMELAETDSGRLIYRLIYLYIEGEYSDLGPCKTTKV